MLRRGWGIGFGLSLAVGSVGCGGGAGSGSFAPKNPFPSRGKLAQLAAAQAKPVAARNVASAPEWKVDPAGLDTPPPVETRFGAVAKGSVTFTRELRCVSRELARFYADHGAPPDERVNRFIGGACGLTTPYFSTGFATGEGTAGATDEQVLTEWQKSLKVPDGHKGDQAGIGFARKGDKLVVATAFVKPNPTVSVVIERADAAGVVVVRGTAPAKTEAMLALINRGAGVASCEPDVNVPLPAFSFRCTMAPDDKSAWIEVSAQPEGRLLTGSIALALARRDANAPVDYVTTRREAAGDDLSASLLDAVNRARTAAGAPAVTLAPKQSATNAQLAPHFFSAELENDQDKTDLVGLGLIAGWDVDGMIRDGNFYASLLSGSGDGNAWIDYALESPMGRHTMLAPGAKQIAIGVPPKEAIGGMGAVVTTYEFFGNEDHAADAQRVLLRLQRARIARGLSKPVPIKGLDRMKAQAVLVNRGQKDAYEALTDALSEERDRAGVGVKGWVVGTNDIETMPLPPELLTGPQVQVGIEVTHYRPEGAPWGMYVVFFLVPAGSAAPQQQTASASCTPTTGRLSGCRVVGQARPRASAPSPR